MFEEASERIREHEDQIAAEQHTVIDALLDNRERREETRREADDARQELKGLLTRGKATGLDVAKMAREAGISRETAHKLLREAKGGEHAS
jgi:transcriptional regulator of acetoin/glycerol metabolism